MPEKIERFHRGLIEATKYINKNYKGRRAKEEGRALGRGDRRWLARQIAAMITEEMRGDGLTLDELHTFIDAAAELLLEEDD